MKIQDSYKEKMNAQLKEWSAQIDVLEAKVESTNADLKVKRAEAVRDLRVKQRAASAKMAELNAATGEAWDTIKDTAETVWNDLKAGISAAHDKFK